MSIVHFQVLYEIADRGPTVLVNPKEVYLNLIRYGLVSDSPMIAGDRVPLVSSVLYLFRYFFFSSLLFNFQQF